MASELEVNPPQVLVLDFVLIFVLFFFMIFLNPIYNVLKHLHVLKEDCQGWTAVDHTEKHSLLNFFDRHLLVDELLEPEHLEYVSLAVLAVQAQK